MGFTQTLYLASTMYVINNWNYIHWYVTAFTGSYLLAYLYTAPLHICYSTFVVTTTLLPVTIHLVIYTNDTMHFKCYSRV